MTIQQLQYIVALDNHRHFVRAAESCHVTQPTLTLQVKKLEAQIGLQIFDRSTQPLTVTPMGQKIIFKARQVLREIEQLKEMVNTEKNRMQGTFRLGIIPSLSPYLLPPFLKEFTQRFPQARLQINEFQTEGIIEGLEANTLDIGILVTPINEPQIREIPLFYEPFLLYAHTEHPLLERKEVTTSDLNEKGLWILSQGHCFREQTLNLCQRSNDLAGEVNVQFESGSIETLKNMISSISGYTLIPELAFNPQREAENVRRFASPEPAREVSIVVHNSFSKELLLAHLKKTILDQVPASFKKTNSFVRVDWR